MACAKSAPLIPYDKEKNMKKVIISMLIVLSVFALVGCASAKKSGSNEVTLTLESNPTTGCTWSVKVEDESIATFVGSEYTPKDNPQGMVGVGGHDTLTFKCLKQGETKVELNYGHAWNAAETYETKEALIKVNADLTGTIELI